jgi:hypothetical protein
MTLDLDYVYKILLLLSLVLSIGAVFYAWFANRRKDIDRRFHEGSKRMDRHDLRLQAVEQDVKSMPGTPDLHRLEMQLVSISGDMKAISATMTGMHKSLERTENIVGRHEDHLRGNGQ